jgi:hypothetical protein
MLIESSNEKSLYGHNAELNLSNFFWVIRAYCLSIMSGPTHQSLIAAIIPAKMATATPSALMIMAGTAPDSELAYTVDSGYITEVAI